MPTARGIVPELDPACDGLPDAARRDAVEHCDIYVGLFGADYGGESKAGASPVEREFDRAVTLGKHRLIFVKGAEGAERHPGMRALIDRAQAGIARRRFTTPAEVSAAADLHTEIDIRQLQGLAEQPESP